MKLKQKKRKIQITIDSLPETPKILKTSSKTYQYFDLSPQIKRSHTLGDNIQLSLTQPLMLSNPKNPHKPPTPSLRRTPSSHYHSNSVIFSPNSHQQVHQKQLTPKSKLEFIRKKIKNADTSLQKKIGLEIKFKEIIKCFKIVVQEISKIFAEMQEQFHQMFQKVHQDIANIVGQLNKDRHIISVEKQKFEQKEKQKQKINIEESFIGKYNQQFSEKIEFSHQVPTLDLSKIIQGSEKPRQTSKKQKFSHRKAQTERNVQQKTFDFSIPMRTSRKFENFNETLNKIKRLSFGGAILKL